jgi:hypothetical protein
VVLTVWGVLVTLLADLWQATGHILLTPSGLSGAAMTALAVSLLVSAGATCLATACWLGRIAAAAPPACRAAALREKTWRAAFLPQRDPDAAGRPRPRAPSAALAAA